MDDPFIAQTPAGAAVVGEVVGVFDGEAYEAQVLDLLALVRIRRHLDQALDDGRDDLALVGQWPVWPVVEPAPDGVKIPLAGAIQFRPKVLNEVAVSDLQTGGAFRAGQGSRASGFIEGREGHDLLVGPAIAGLEDVDLGVGLGEPRGLDVALTVAELRAASACAADP